MKTSIDRFIPLLLIAVIITSQLISFVHPDSTAAQTTEVDPNYKVYSEFAPAVTVDGNKNSIIVWQDPHTREIKAQKMNKDSIHVWQQNVILANPIGVADFLSIDTDKAGNIFVSWSETSSRSTKEVLYLQKFNTQGDKIWSDPFVVITTKDALRDFHVFYVTPVKVDNNGNAFYAFLKKNTKTNTVELLYQVVNSTGEFRNWEEGKKLATDAGMFLTDRIGVDLELNKASSIAFLSWIDAHPYNNGQFKSINITKINYDGVFMWPRPYHIYIDGYRETFEYPGIKVDERENISIAFLTYMDRTRYWATIQARVINSNQQELWKFKDTVKFDPHRQINDAALAVDNNHKFYLLLDTKNEIAINAFHEGLNSGKTEDFQKMFETVLQKPAIGPGVFPQAHTDLSGIANMGNNIVIVWNQFDASFDTPQPNEYKLKSTANEKTMMQIFNRDLAQITEPVQVNSSLARTSQPVASKKIPDTKQDDKETPPQTIKDIFVSSLDSDNDGLDDVEELVVYKTDPKNPDSDFDGYLDGEEVANNYNPLGICRVKRFNPTGPTHAYGVNRVADLSDEQCRSNYLHTELQALLTPVEYERALTHWSTFLNAFIYGDYPIPAIVSAIRYDSRVVHPTIHWNEWRNTSEYINNIH